MFLFFLYMFLLVFFVVLLCLFFFIVLWFIVIILLSSFLCLYGEEIVEYWESVRCYELRVIKFVILIDKYIKIVG